MITLDEVVEFIHNPLAYEQKLVSIINTKGEQILLSSPSELYTAEASTIKIEGMEKYSKQLWEESQYYAIKYKHYGPVTCHAFIAKENSPSFPLHTDPDDIVIRCVEGVKDMEVSGEYIILEPGQEIYIPANTEHRAINKHHSLMFSFGLEKFLKDKAQDYELDVLSQNDRNL
jgi:mannose-6-phosphate isomerase-like protein (cupin superfamily)